MSDDLAASLLLVLRLKAFAPTEVVASASTVPSEVLCESRPQSLKATLLPTGPSMRKATPPEETLREDESVVPN